MYKERGGREERERGLVSVSLLILSSGGAARNPSSIPCVYTIHHHCHILILIPNIYMLSLFPSRSPALDGRTMRGPCQGKLSSGTKRTRDSDFWLMPSSSLSLSLSHSALLYSTSAYIVSYILSSQQHPKAYICESFRLAEPLFCSIFHAINVLFSTSTSPPFFRRISWFSVPLQIRNLFR